MTTTYTGKVFWANNVPLANVETRLFSADKDGNLGTELDSGTGSFGQRRHLQNVIA